MKKIVLLLLIAFLSCNLSYAVKAYPGLITHQQPDGSLIKYYLKGDENYSYMVSEDGFLLTYQEDGSLVYGELCIERGSVRPAKEKVKALSVSRQLDSLFNLNVGRVYSAQKRAFTNVGYPLTGSPKSLVILVNFQETI